MAKLPRQSLIFWWSSSGSHPLKLSETRHFDRTLHLSMSALFCCVPWIWPLEFRPFEGWISCYKTSNWMIQCEDDLYTGKTQAEDQSFLSQVYQRCLWSTSALFQSWDFLCQLSRLKCLNGKAWTPLFHESPPHIWTFVAARGYSNTPAYFDYVKQHTWRLIKSCSSKCQWRPIHLSKTQEVWIDLINKKELTAYYWGEPSNVAYWGRESRLSSRVSCLSLELYTRW